MVRPGGVIHDDFVRVLARSRVVVIVRVVVDANVARPPCYQCRINH